MIGWMGFRLAPKLKFLKKPLNEWKKDSFGKVEDQMVTLLHEFNLLGVKEENDGLQGEQIQHCRFLREEFR